MTNGLQLNKCKLSFHKVSFISKKQGQTAHKRDGSFTLKPTKAPFNAALIILRQGSVSSEPTTGKIAPRSEHTGVAGGGDGGSIVLRTNELSKLNMMCVDVSKDFFCHR